MSKHKAYLASVGLVALSGQGMAQTPTTSPSASAPVALAEVVQSSAPKPAPATAPESQPKTASVSTQATPGAASATNAAPASSDIVVTAQKREQRLQDVPISIEVVTGRKLQTFDVIDLRQMAKFAPNVTIVNSPASDAIYIRGFGSTPGNYSFEPSVSLYEDGVYAGRQKQAQGPFFDLERVEVLRGPQGALFGKNTAAGAVSIVTAGPGAHFTAAANALYNFDIKGPAFEGYVSGPITDTFGARLAVKYLDQDGWVTNNYNGQKEPAFRQALARLTLRFTPSSAFDYTVKAEYADAKVTGGNSISTPLDSEAVPRLYRYTTPNFFGTEGSRTKSQLVSGTGNLAIGDHTLTSVTSYSHYTSQLITTFDLTTPTGAVTNSSNETSFPERFHQFAQEVRLASPTGGRFEYLVGAYYDRAVFDLTTQFAFDIRNAPVLAYKGQQQSDFHQNSRTLSAFGQATFRIVDGLRLVGSLRTSNTKKSATYNAKLLSGPFPLQPVTSAVGRLSETSTDPSFTVQYDANRDVMFYATYARGSKSGGFVSNTFGTTDATFQFRPEKSENYEAGVKSVFAKGLLTLNLSAFETKFKDLQTSAFNPITTGQVISNAAKARSRGLEGLIGLRPNQYVDFSLTAAYADAKYTDYPGAPCLATQPLTVCNNAVPALVAANNLAGIPLPYNSKFSYSAQGHMRVPTGNSLVIDGTLALSGRSKSFIAVTESPFYGVQKAFAKVDARLQLGRLDAGWFVALIGKNLTNELTATSAYAISFPITSVSRAFRQVDQPRSISVEVGVKF